MNSRHRSRGGTEPNEIHFIAVAWVPPPHQDGVVRNDFRKVFDDLCASLFISLCLKQSIDKGLNLIELSLIGFLKLDVDAFTDLFIVHILSCGAVCYFTEDTVNVCFEKLNPMIYYIFKVHTYMFISASDFT